MSRRSSGVMMNRKLHLEIEAAKRLKEKLVAAYGDDDDLIRDMVEGETSLHECIGKAALELATVEGEIEGVKIAKARLEERLQRHLKRSDGIREAIQSAMETAELNSLKTPVATLSMRASPPRVEITDPGAIPVAFLVQPPPSPDKRAISSALKSGEAIPGATLSNQPPSLTVRYT